MTPDCVDEIEEALTVPFLALVPCTVTVSPGRSAEREDLAFRFTVVLEPTVTATSWPLASVTYKVWPMMSVTVPEAALDEPGATPVGAPAPPEVAKGNDPPKGDAALDDDE